MDEHVVNCFDPSDQIQSEVASIKFLILLNSKTALILLLPRFPFSDVAAQNQPAHFH